MSYDSTLMSELALVAGRVADAARSESLAWFRTGLSVDNKESDGFDPVTEGDRAAERAMRRVLSDLRPQDGILGEEYGERSGESGLTWVLDPIDGTRGYLCGAPVWGTLVAVSDASGPLLGLIDQPHIGERFFGGPDGAHYTGPRSTGPLRCRPYRPLDQALLLTTFPEIGTEDERAAFGRVASHARLVRYGLDCYAYALLALGQVDLVIEAGLQPYDIQGPMAVVKAAGGIVTDWRGGPAHLGGQVIAAANPEIHAEALALLAG